MQHDMGYLSTIKSVLMQSRYAAIAAISALGLFGMYWFVTMPQFLQHFEMVYAAQPLLSIGRTSAVVAISALGGMNIALVIFRLRGIKAKSCSMKSTGSGVFGGALAAFTPGCPACTSVLSVALGAAGGLAVLPYGGFELRVVSLVAVVFSMLWITRDIRKALKINASESKSFKC